MRSARDPALCGLTVSKNMLEFASQMTADISFSFFRKVDKTLLYRWCVYSKDTQYGYAYCNFGHTFVMLGPGVPLVKLRFVPYGAVYKKLPLPIYNFFFHIKQ